MALNNEYIGYKTKVSSEEISKDGVLSYLSAIGSTNNYYSDNNVAPHMFNVVQEIGLVESIWKMEDLYESKEEMDRSVLMLVHGEQTMNFSRMLKFGEKIDSYALIENIQQKGLNNILKLLNQKKIISVISDAGTPVISDPGSILINECILNNINIYPIPGVSASTTAISISGFSDKYFFGGFLPEKKKDLNNLFDIITKLNFSFVFFISPKKLKKIINEIQKYFIDNDILIAREISKLHEEYIRIKVRNLSELEISQKGEMTVVISQNLKPQNRLQLLDESVKKKINKLLKKMSIRDITSKITLEHNVSKKLVYDYCLEKKNGL